MRSLVAALLFVSSASFAAEPPTAAELKRFLDYEENGKDLGPVLLEAVACLKVDTTKGSPTAFTCVEPVTGPVKKGTVVHLWTLWFCPKGGKYEDITVQFSADGKPQAAQPVSIEGQGRTRNWKAQGMKSAGKWTAAVSRGGKELAQVAITVEN